MSITWFINLVFLTHIYSSSCYILKFHRRTAHVRTIPIPSKEEHYDKYTPEECRGLTYCEKTPSNFLIHNEDEFAKKFNLTSFASIDQSLLERRNRTYTGQDDCPTKSGYMRLSFVRKDTRDDWMKVLKLEYIWYEKCQRPKPGDEGCFKKAEFFAGRVARCVQEYNDIFVLTASEKGNPVHIPIRIPKCCSCKIRDVRTV